MNRSFLLIGGNIGDRNLHLKKARKLIKQMAGKIITSSSVYETAAWGIEDQPAFLNQVLLVETLLNAEDLLACLLLIENKMGRIRSVKFGPRIIDLDILFYNDEVVETADLKIPHPALEFRRFALLPLDEIAGSFIHPTLHKTVHELLLQCTDPLQVTRME